MIMTGAEYELTKLPRLVSFVLTEEKRPSRSHLNSPRTCGRGGDLEVDDDVLVDIDAGVDIDADVDVYFDVDVDVDFDVDADAEVKRYLAHLALHDVCVLLQGLVQLWVWLEVLRHLDHLDLYADGLLEKDKM